MKTKIFTTGVLAATICLFGVVQAMAEDDLQTGVARVSLINGEISIQRGDTGDWLATTVNAPLVQGDKVSTGTQSHVEIQLDHSNILRLDQRAEAKLAALSRTRIQVQISRGLLNLSVFKGSEADVEIDTPNAAVRPLEEGIYRVQVNSDSETEVIVRKGRAEVSTPEGSTRIDKNDRMVIQGTDAPQYRVAKAPGRDDWDRWNQDRDHVISDARSWQYANRYYTGVHELDRYGHWDSVPGYGSVWSPYGDPDWSPYSSGRWVWEPFWGWTWVSYEPWGWAPYHYGRWFVYGSSWRWWPGPVYASYRPLWAPAYVSFLGFGFGGRHSGFGFGFGYHSIGWLPLGPCDTYYPWYGARHSYNAVNITNIRNITNVNNIHAVAPLADRRTRPYFSNVQSVLNNDRVRRSVSSITTEDFVQGRMGARSRIVDAQTMRQAQLVAGTVPAVPTRESLRPVDRAVNPASLPSRNSSTEKFFARNQPPAGPQPFTQRAAEIQQMVQRHNPAASNGQTTPVSAGQKPVSSSVQSLPDVTSRGGTLQRIQNRQIPGDVQGNDVGGKNGNSPTPPPPAAASTANKGQRNFPDYSRRTGETSAQPTNPSTLPLRQENRVLRNTPPSSQLENSVSQQPSTPGWQRFGNAGSSRGVQSERAAQPALAPWNSRPSGAEGSRSRHEIVAPADRNLNDSNTRSQPEGRSWNRFPSQTQTGTDRREFDRYSQFPQREMSSPSIRRDTPAPMRQESPIYRESQRRMDRPPLEMRKPIVTERAPRAYDGGGFRGGRSEPRGERGGGRNSSPPPSRSSDHRGRR